MKTTTGKTIAIASVSAVLVIGAYIAIVGLPSKTSNTDSSSTSTVTKTVYKNGVYEASTTYKVPGSTNTLNASITIENDVITKITTTNTVTSQKSKEYTDPFDSGISKEVVGKKLGSAKISILSGASLTTNAYNTVLDSVISKAQN